MSETIMKPHEIVEKALPCPFCGERLVLKDDHHGEWVAHRGACFISEIQLHTADDLLDWNRRTKPASKGPAGDRGQVGWMGGEFDR